MSSTLIPLISLHSRHQRKNPSLRIRWLFILPAVARMSAQIDFLTPIRFLVLYFYNGIVISGKKNKCGHN